MQYVLILLVVVVILAIAARIVKRVVVFEHERAILYRNGRFMSVLEPGAYWLLSGRSAIRKLDLRPRFASLSGQEVLSADSVALKVSLAAKYAIADPHVAVANSDDYQQALHLELQLALREIVGAFKVDDLLSQRQEISRQLLAVTEPKATALGLALLSAGIKDVMFPGELKKIFAEVVRAQKEGAAALERTRAETASLRSLANAARMIEGNPALLQLRLLQAIGERSGNTVVLGMPPQTTPVPIRQAPPGGGEELPPQKESGQR